MIENISYKEAEKKSLSWNGSDKMVFLFSDSRCDMCEDFVELAAPHIYNAGIKIYRIFVDSEKIPFPPTEVPETYWFIDKDIPVIRRSGLPPNKESLIGFLKEIGTD